MSYPDARAAFAALTLSALLLTGCPPPKPPRETNWRHHPGLAPHPADQAEHMVRGWHGAAAPMVAPAEEEEPASDVIDRKVEEAAARGEAWALTMIGKNKVESAVEPEQVREGVAMVRRAADNGDAGAQYELAFMYAEGRGVMKDLELALLWGRKAAQQGNTQAQLSVGRTLVESGSPEQKTEGMNYLRQAAEGGNVNAVLLWATVVGKGEHGVPKDEAYAEALLKPWAEKGDADCQFVLAALYKFGDTFAARREEAQVWLQRAADQGHAKALEILQLGER